MGLAAVVGEAAVRPLFGLSDAELAGLLDEVSVAVARLDGLLLRLVREVDGRGIAAAAGATSTGAWLRERLRLAPATGQRWVKLAAAVDGSVVGAALSAGRINVEQAGVIATAVASVPAEHRIAGAKLLVKQAVTFGPRELSQLGERLVELLDPDGADAAEARRLEQTEQRAYVDRAIHLTDAGDGRTRVTGWLDREGAAVLRAALDPLCNPRTLPQPATEVRTAAQRRADAIVEVCRLAMAAAQLPDHGGDRPQLVVTIDWAALRDEVGAGWLDDGQALSVAAVRRVACDAAVLPTVLGGSGQPLDVGRERRVFTGPLRRAVMLRDRGCAFPGCDRPPRWTQVHHLRHWIDGGATSLDNAVAVCGHHHRVLHQGQWQVKINHQDGHPDFWPPPHLDISGPVRNTYHRRQ